nr:uncharacterized protein LOC109191246 [Ipomoea batatas]
MFDRVYSFQRIDLVKSFQNPCLEKEKKSWAYGKRKVILRIEKPTAVAANSHQNADTLADVEPTLIVPPSSGTSTSKACIHYGGIRGVMADIGKQRAPMNVMKKTFSGISNMETFTAAVDALFKAFEKIRKQKAPNGQPRIDALVDRIAMDVGVSSSQLPKETIDVVSTSNPNEQTSDVIRVPFARVSSPTTNDDDFDRNKLNLLFLRHFERIAASSRTATSFSPSRRSHNTATGRHRPPQLLHAALPSRHRTAPPLQLVIAQPFAG